MIVKGDKMDSAARVKPLPPGEVTFIHSKTSEPLKCLKDEARPQTLGFEIKLEKVADAIALKFSMAEFRVYASVLDAPVKLTSVAVRRQVEDYGKIISEKLASHITKIAEDEGREISPEITKKLEKLFKEKAVPLIHAPPHFNGGGFMPDKLEDIKAAALLLLVENTRSEKK